MHLLKENSKPVPQQRKRMKRDVFGTPAHFNALAGQHSQVPQQQQEEKKGGEAPSAGDSMHGGSGPNIIGNLNDPSTIPLNI